MIMYYGIWWVLSVTSLCAAEWQWPGQAASVRIDTKVRFLDESDRDRPRGGQRQGEGDKGMQDEVPFQEPFETDGFYNRPRGAGRYPVRVEVQPYKDEAQAYSAHDRRKNIPHSDGTLDSLQYCKCVDTPDCSPRHDSNRACGSGKYLCCYKKPNKSTPQNTEYFNEIDDERPSLLPGREPFARPFPPPPSSGLDAAFGPGHGHAAVIGAAGGSPDVLVGPGGPTGLVGPVAPPGDDRRPAVLVGPGGPTGVVGPAPVGNIKGDLGGLPDATPGETAQRGVLVGPEGPTGVIGPRGYGQRPTLVGPGGPTGFIGPRMRGYLGRFFNQFAARQANPGILVGPGGPTGTIGPGRPLLVGPGGPTGVIGPQY